MLVKRFKQQFSRKVMCTCDALEYLGFITRQNHIKDNLADSKDIIRLQSTFTDDTLMIDESTVGAIQVYDRNLLRCIIQPDFCVMARSGRIFHVNIIRESAANR